MKANAQKRKPCPVCGFHSDVESVRSVHQHRRYFALIKAVHHHWPEAHPRQFADPEALRAFLQMKAGWREVAAQIPIDGLPRETLLAIVEAAIRSCGSYALPILHKDTLVVFKPKSIAFHKMTHGEFCELNTAVEAVIRQETGTDAELILKEHERAS